MNKDDFFSKIYPMQYHDREAQRLDNQALVLYDPSIETLIQNANHCLEIGCGSGSNLSTLRQTNPNLNYTGVDLNDFAIATARNNYCDDQRTHFVCTDGRKLPFENESFDLVICKLVLWSIGSDWKQVVEQAYRVLKPGGFLYCFEPDDQFLLVWPKRTPFEKLLHVWQRKVVSSGMDPFIGRQLYAALIEAGFSSTLVRPYQIVSTGNAPERFRNHLDNLKGLFLSRGPSFFDLTETAPEWQDGLKSFDTFDVKDLLIETHIVAIGRKE